MKRIIVALLLFIIMTNTFAQDSGVHFVHGLCWKEVIAKATKEHKYIFVDCFTTWCGPCKVMSSQIFPQKEVGEYFNAHYISVKAQMDKTKNDNEEIKARYQDASMLEKEYEVHVYPTFLYFSPEGIPVHRSAGSGSAEDIINEGKKAFTTDKAFYVLLKKFKSGKITSPAFLTLVNEAVDARESHADTLTNEYIRTQKNMFTKDNITLLVSSTHITSDTGFSIISANEKQYDSLTFKGAGRKIIIETLTASTYNTLYEFQKNNEEPNWEAYESVLTDKYPAYSKQTVLFSKVAFYLRAKKGKQLTESAISYFNTYPENCEQESLNNWAWNIFLTCDDTALLIKALPLSKKSFEKDNKPENIDTYASLLYRAGRKEEAIQWETKALNLATNDKEQYQSGIDKMKKNEKIWENQ